MIRGDTRRGGALCSTDGNSTVLSVLFRIAIVSSYSRAASCKSTVIVYDNNIHHFFSVRVERVFYFWPRTPTWGGTIGRHTWSMALSAALGDAQPSRAWRYFASCPFLAISHCLLASPNQPHYCRSLSLSPTSRVVGQFFEM